MMRFWDKVDMSGECWEWTASTNSQGYGQFGFNGKVAKAHRVAYELAYGSIPSGMCICHHCDNPLCVRISHLFLGTRSDNQKDAVTKGRMRQPDNRGEKHAMSRLISSDIYEIRRLHSLGIMQRTIAKAWKISDAHVSRIINKTRWKHI